MHIQWVNACNVASTIILVFSEPRYTINNQPGKVLAQLVIQIQRNVGKLIHDERLPNWRIGCMFFVFTGEMEAIQTEFIRTILSDNNSENI